MISVSKSTLNPNNLPILRHNVTKKLQICVRSFVNPHPDKYVKSSKKEEGQIKR